MAIESAVRDGVISDWDLFEKLWEYSINDYIRVDVKQTPVLMAEKPYNPPSSRQK